MVDIYKETNYLSEKGKKLQELEWNYGCHNYYPVPAVLESGEGVYLTDVDGKKYLDFLSAYSAVNQGHCHPKIINAAIEQMKKLTLTSRAFYNSKLGPAEEYLCKLFKYEKCIFMNTGVEGGETAVKLARRWGYDVKKVPDNKAVVLFAKGNFWGRTIAACSSSEDPDRFRRFGPFTPGLELIDFDSPEALENKCKADPNVCAYMVEPIQGEAGVVMPKDGYLKKIREICTKYNVLLIFDEVQTGLGRTGKLLAHYWEEGVRPDMVILGKALSGGVYPISAVLCDNIVMNNIHPGEHGSTFGGNPLAAEIAVTAMKVLIDEKMCENSLAMGELFRQEFLKLKSPLVKGVRGKGLFNAVELTEGAWQFCLNNVKRGLLAKTTHGSTVRFGPPLVINKAQIMEAVKICGESLKELEGQIKAGTAVKDH